MQNTIALPSLYGPISGYKESELIFIPLNPVLFSFVFFKTSFSLPPGCFKLWN